MKPGCWPFVLAILVLLVIISASSGRSVETPSSKTITVCRIEYTALGKQANWHFDFLYIVKTNEKGLVEDVTKLEKDKRPSFINEDRIVACVKGWNLFPAGKYVALFSIGTNTENNSVSVRDPNGNLMKLVLQEASLTR